MNKAEIKRQIYGAIAAWLRREVQVDIDDPEFYEVAWGIQNDLAKQFETKAVPRGRT